MLDKIVYFIDRYFETLVLLGFVFVLIFTIYRNV